MMRVGVGWDSHALAEGRRFLSGGVEIPTEHLFAFRIERTVFSRGNALYGIVSFKILCLKLNLMGVYRFFLPFCRLFHILMP
jgi:hypothetical protein